MSIWDMVQLGPLNTKMKMKIFCDVILIGRLKHFETVYPIISQKINFALDF